ncbi:MAG: hypothetical protein HC841_09310 [Verrucomicrobiae bacterium]|nr:hypothetical protein [Verrucomicrobiae bacterium]
MVLRIEALARDAAGLPELKQIAVNETRKINRARQIFLLDLAGRRGAVSVSAVSGVSTPDRYAPVISGVTQLIARLQRERPLTEAIDFTLPAYCDPRVNLRQPIHFVRWRGFRLSTGGARCSAGF